MILKINNNKNGDNNCHDYDRDNCSLNDSDSGVTILSKIYTFGDTLGVRGGGGQKVTTPKAHEQNNYSPDLVDLTNCTVAMVTNYAMNITATCSTMTGHN